MKISKITPVFVYYLSLLFALLFATIFIFYDSQIVTNCLFNSDILYFPTLYKDLFIDHYQLSGWTIPGSPNLFPDMLLYFVLMFFTGSIPVTTYLFGILQFFAILLLFRMLIRYAFPDASYYSLAIGNLLISLFFFTTFVNKDVYLSFLLISNTYHLGSFVNALIALVLSFAYLRNNRWIYLILLLLLGIVAIVSDRLFIIMYCIPFVTSLLFFIRKNRNFYTTLYILIPIALMLILGMVIFDRVSHNQTIHVAKAYFNVTQEGMLTSWIALYKPLLLNIQQFTVFGWIILLSILSMVLAIIYFFRNISSLWKGPLIDTKNGMKQFMNLFFIVFMIAVFFTPVITGGFQGFDTIRYNIFVFYFGLLYLGSLLLYFFDEKKWIKNVLKFSTFIILFVFIGFLGYNVKDNKPAEGFKKYVNYYPSVASCLDAMDEKYDLKQGVSTYWFGKVATAFSKRDNRLYTVYDENLVPYSHVGNENWYFETGTGKYDPPVFNFILLAKPLNDTALERIEERLGKIILTEECGNFVLIKVNDFQYARNSPFPVARK